MEKKKPVGVTVIAWIEILIGGLSSLISGSFLIIFGIKYIEYVSSGYESTCGDAEWMMLGIIVSAGLALPSLLFLISGINILRLANWARILNIGLAVSLPICIFILLFLLSGRGYLSAIFLTFISASIPAVLKIWYFMRPNVKNQFKEDVLMREIKKPIK